MTIKKINYHVLAVGQGNGTLVVYEDAGGKPVDIVMMDFGSDLTTVSASGAAALTYTLSILEKMDKPIRIAAVFFSHSDFDHVSLMSELLKRYTPAQLRIDRVFYGGGFGNYVKKGVNVLDTLRPYMLFGTPLRKFTANYSSFSGATATSELTVQGCDFYVLVANTASPQRAASIAAGKETKDSYLINTESLVVISRVGAYGFVMAGDATAQTLQKVNNIISNSTAAQGALRQIFHATIPHHGSYTTTAETRNLDDRDWKATLTTYTRWLQAKSASVTAGVENSHSHPSAYIVQYYWPFLFRDLYTDEALKPLNLHLTTQYFDPANPVGPPGEQWPTTDEDPSWETVQTTFALFTNHYWETGGLYILPPMPYEDAETNPEDLSPDARPQEVHWELRIDLDRLMVAIHRYPSARASQIGRALLASGPESGFAIPDWDELRHEAGAIAPVMSFPLGDSIPEPRRRPRPVD